MYAMADPSGAQLGWELAAPPNVEDELHWCIPIRIHDPSGQLTFGVYSVS
jgi:hypothetical protein